MTKLYLYYIILYKYEFEQALYFMIKISRQADYALQLIVGLSKLKKGERLSLKMFSNKSSISFLFLQKIAKKLREAKLIEAIKGKRGGYRLKKATDKITLKDVIEAIEGPYGATDCSKLNRECQKADKCGIKHGLGKLNSQIIKYLESVTVSSMEQQKMSDVRV